MGMNYYHHRDVCPTCGRAGEVEHIGKSSGGWTFSFHGTPEISGWSDWLKVLRQGGEIRDECGDLVSLADFEALVGSKQSSDRHHAREYPDGCWTDPDGHSFSGYEFS